jgi:molecular chaperone HtpG
MKADLSLEGEDDAKKDTEETDESKADEQPLGTLLERFTKVLEEQVSAVRVSRRLVDSPACLVIPDGGLQPHIEQMLRLSQGMNIPKTKRILELNPDHALVASLKALNEKDGESSLVTDLIQVLYDQALLAEGSPLEEPARLANHVTQLAERVARAEAGA